MKGNNLMKNGSSAVLLALLAFGVCMVCAGSAYAQTTGAVRVQAEEGRANNAGPSAFEGIKKTYSAIQTLEARFHQKVVIATLKKERDSDGEFFYKRNRGFLWKYRTPKSKTFLYDGKSIWQADEDKPFVIKEKIRKEKTGGTFLDLIEDIAKIDDLFTLKQQTKSGDLDVLELVPKKEGSVTSAKIWIDKQYRVKKIEILEFTGNTNSIEFSAIRINQSIDDNRFAFKPEKGIEIIER
ncbi:MAG TPA: outer membrane lipoprotein chaperone LolA [Syntrophorhabdaceae bacterium]|jgi:chaperone LolA